MNKKISYFTIIFILFITIFLIALKYFKGLVVFDTLREYGNMYNFFIKQGNGHTLDWGMYYLNGFITLITGTDGFYIHYFGGIFLILLASVFFFIIAKDLSKDYYLALFFTFLFITGTSIFSSIFYYRLQTLSILFHIFFIYILKKANSSNKSNLYLILTFIITLFSINLHKTTKILPFIFILFWVYYFIKNKSQRKNLPYLFLLILLIIILKYQDYRLFFDFYLGSGKLLDPVAFNQPTLSIDYFLKKFGFFFLAVIPLLINTLIKNKDIYDLSKKDNFIFFLSSIFFIIYFGISYILPNFNIFSVNLQRFDLFIYPFLLLFLLFVIRKFNNKTFFILMILFLIITYVPPDFSESKKLTANMQYFSELRGLGFNKGDIIITTYTSVPAIKASLDYNLDNKRFEIYVLGGYHDWGQNNEQIALIRSLYNSQDENIFINKICENINFEKELIKSIPIFPEFLTPNQFEKENIVKLLDEKKRILFFIPLFDQKVRPKEISKDIDIKNWWRDRTIEIENYELFVNFSISNNIYESENIIVLEINLDCE